MIDMKKPIKIVQCRDGKWIVKKRGWFGWVKLVEIYNGNWSWHYHWSYFFEPSSSYDRFDSKEKAITSLSEYYHDNRKLRELREELA